MIDLQSFCADPDDQRVYLTRPFSIGDYTLASNGHILIRIARQDGILPPENMPEKVAMAALSQLEITHRKLGCETGILRLDDFNPESLECDTCAGTGKIHCCPECGGYGETGGTSELDNENCATCDGLGHVPSTHIPALREKFPQAKPYTPDRCPSCYGLGKCCADKKYQLGETTLGTQYLLLAKTLPDATVYTFGPPPDPAMIIFDGGLGVLMPRRD